MRFVFEVEFELTYDAWFPVTFSPDHPEARVEAVTCRAERDISGKVTRWVGVLLVRDMNSFRHPEPRQVIVVRKAGRITEVPEWADKLIGTFSSDRGETDWYVFSARATSVKSEASASPAPPPAPPATPTARNAALAAAKPPPASPAPERAKSVPPPAADSWLSGLS
jgi:hypothetical protein